jgi:hypothetical protein
MVAILAVAMVLIGLVVVVPVQQASAQDTSFSFNSRLTNKCSGILALIYCETSSVTFGGPVTGGAGGGTSGPQSPGGSGGTVGCGSAGGSAAGGAGGIGGAGGLGTGGQGTSGGTGGASSCSVQ